MGESQPPRLPSVFMRPETEPECFSERSMQAAQKVAAANMLRPAAKASMRMAANLLGEWPPLHSRTADPDMPSHTAVFLPRRRPIRRTAKSENQPPAGENTAIAR